MTAIPKLPAPFTLPLVKCPACDHGIDPHGVDPGGECGVGGCPCLWSPNDIAADLDQPLRAKWERDVLERFLMHGPASGEMPDYLSVLTGAMLDTRSVLAVTEGTDPTRIAVVEAAHEAVRAAVKALCEAPTIITTESEIFEVVELDDLRAVLVATEGES